MLFKLKITQSVACLVLIKPLLEEEREIQTSLMESLCNRMFQVSNDLNVPSFKLEETHSTLLSLKIVKSGSRLNFQDR